MQVVNVFLCRSEPRSVLTTGLFGNRLLGWGVVTAIGLLLLINYSPWFNEILGTRGIDVHTWLFLAPCGAVMLVMEETRKAIVRGARSRAESVGRRTWRGDGFSSFDRDPRCPDAKRND